MRSFLFLFAKITGGVLAVVLLSGLFLNSMQFNALLAGHLLSLLFVGSNLLVVRKIHIEDHQRFYRLFFISTALRFILVLASLILVLKVTKIHQIYFTVSFIISYIFHSGTEIIFINKILETDS